jgi:hypothetical protein
MNTPLLKGESIPRQPQHFPEREIFGSTQAFEQRDIGGGGISYSQTHRIWVRKNFVIRFRFLDLAMLSCAATATIYCGSLSSELAVKCTPQ